LTHLLLLVHRIPFPPNKGDKIRSYHLLAHLAQRFTVHLGTFVDDPDDWKHVNTVKRLCGETCFIALKPAAARLRSLLGLARRKPLSLEYYKDQRMHLWVKAILERHPVGPIVVFSAAMAQYVEDLGGAHRVIDFVDVDSDKWTQYAHGKHWPLSWLYRREGRLLLRYERKIAASFDHALFVSEAEARLFGELAPECGKRIGYYSNGVDTDYFSPDRDYDSPYGRAELPVVFTGAMDYWPNIDAVQWYAQHIFPAVRKRVPAAVFYIVGARPAAQVKALGRLEGVVVTGTVADVRPYLAHARVVVAPLRIARGIQNKVLEAMAMAKATIVSAAALEGIDALPGREVLLAENEEHFIHVSWACLAACPPAIGTAARHKVLEQYGWHSKLARVDQLLQVQQPLGTGAGVGRHGGPLLTAGEPA
jgi:sugar transferase (PEP-CTERM/EpsH1 system associated)